MQAIGTERSSSQRAGQGVPGAYTPPRRGQLLPRKPPIMAVMRTMNDETFVGIYQSKGPNELAKLLGIAPRNVMARRLKLEHQLGVKIFAPDTTVTEEVVLESPDLQVDIKDGVVLVGGDGHYWPGLVPTAHRGFCALAKELKPKVIIFNGDALDGAAISRHPPIGWEDLPTVEEELYTVQERLGEIQQASPKSRLIWPLGNHDARFNTRLAMVASEFRHVPGTRLTHHFPEWENCWAVFLGGERGAVVKHRFKGGIHAPHNNALWSGRTMVTNHLHSLKVIPFTDYNGTRWGVDSGTLSCPTGPQFTYQEKNPANHRAGFAVLTWKKGELLWPELCSVHDEKRGLINWRGDLRKV